MNGATADPPPKTSRMPSINSTRMIGANHHFFRSFRNPQISFKKSMVKVNVLLEIIGVGIVMFFFEWTLEFTI